MGWTPTTGNTEDLSQYLIYCFVGTISSPQWGTQCTKLTKYLSLGESMGGQGQYKTMAIEWDETLQL